MRTFIIGLVLVIATTTVLAQDVKNNDLQQQKWTIELSSGFRSEIFESTNHLYFDLKTGSRLSFPQIEMNFWYSIKDYFALESGLAYVKYNTNWGCGYKMFIPKHNIYSALQIPLRARFSVPLNRSNFSFFSSVGVALQFPLQRSIPRAYIWNNQTVP